MPDYIYPSAVDLQQVAQDKLPRLTAERLGFQILPLEEADTDLVEWEQLDNFTGLQGARGLNGPPGRVKQIGAKLYQSEPGYYGDYAIIDERAITRRRRFGTLGTPIDLSQLVMEKQDQLLQRRLDRQEQVIWATLTTGQVSVPGPTGAVLYKESYSFQTFSAVSDGGGYAWSDHQHATPLADLRKAKLKSRGHSVSFGRDATFGINAGTYADLIGNANPDDLGGKRVENGSTFNTLADINRILLADDLPQIAVYDESYLDDTGAVQLYVPNGTGVLVGRRPAGQRIGSYKVTRNAQNPSAAPGPYMRVIDTGEDSVPREIQVHDGHNGGVAVPFPSAVVIVSL